MSDETMNHVEVGQTVYAFLWGTVREYVVEKVTAKQIKVRGDYTSQTFPRTGNHPPGAVAIGPRDVYVWTTAEEAALSEVQTLNERIRELQVRADAITATYLGGAS